MQKPLWFAGLSGDSDPAVSFPPPLWSLLMFSFTGSLPPRSAASKLLLSGSSLAHLNFSTSLRAFGLQISSSDAPRKQKAYLIIGFIHLPQKYISSYLTHTKVVWYLRRYRTCPHSYSNQIPENLALNPLLNPISNPSTHSDHYLLWSEYQFYCNSL